MPTWRDLSDQLAAATAQAFDYGAVSFQKMDGADPVGDPVPVRAEFDGAFVNLDLNDGGQASTVGPALIVRYGDLPGVDMAPGDRFILATGAAAGTYVVDDVQPDADRVSATVKLKRQTKA